MIIVFRYNIPTVIYKLIYVRSRITTGLLYSIFGLRVLDDGTVLCLLKFLSLIRFLHICLNGVDQISDYFFGIKSLTPGQYLGI